jgi:hypothetical protein
VNENCMYKIIPKKGKKREKKEEGNMRGNS